MEWASDNDGRYAASSYLIYGFLQVAGRPDDAGPPLLARALALRGQERERAGVRVRPVLPQQDFEKAIT